MNTWNNEDLEGNWLVTRKVDGVCVLVDEGGFAWSRKGKPLYNISTDTKAGTYECFKDNWETSVSMVRTRDSDIVDSKYLYSIIDPIDPRLIMGEAISPSKKLIKDLYSEAVAEGFEGLVLHSEGKTLKVKPSETYDVKVEGYQEGKGRHLGRLGALLTEKGKVGTGFKDIERRADLYPIGSVIEVEAMGLTPNGLFRHPRFLRARFDK